MRIILGEVLMIFLTSFASVTLGTAAGAPSPTPVATVGASHHLAPADVASVFSRKDCPGCCDVFPKSEWVTFGDRKEFLVINEFWVQPRPEVTVSDLREFKRFLKKVGLKGAVCVNGSTGILISVPKGMNVISVSEEINARKGFSAKPSKGRTLEDAFH